MGVDESRVLEAKRGISFVVAVWRHVACTTFPERSGQGLRVSGLEPLETHRAGRQPRGHGDWGARILSIPQPKELSEGALRALLRNARLSVDELCGFSRQ